MKELITLYRTESRKSLQKIVLGTGIGKTAAGIGRDRKEGGGIGGIGGRKNRRDRREGGK